MGRNRKTYSEAGVSTSKEVERRKKKMKMKKQMRRRRITTLIITLIIVAIIGGGIYIYSFLSGLNSSSLPGAVDPIGKNPVNILLLGMDVGDADQAENKVGQRTDTMMVLNYNPSTKKAQIVSIPRDTKIEVDGAYDKNGNSQKIWKMNAAYPIDGEKEVTLQVEKILEIKINYMVKVDYSAFRKIIDAIGGVEMYIEQDMFYDAEDQNLHINFKAGETVNLDGEEAEKFVRWRKNNDGSGFPNADLGRIENQQKFISKAIEKCLSPSVVVKIPKILKAVSDSLDTNLDANQMLKYAMQMVKLNKEDIVMTTLQGESKDIYDPVDGLDISYFIYNKQMNLELLKSLHSGEVTGSAGTSGKTNTVDVAEIELKSNLKIMVLNATSINGLAGKLQAKLNELGYGNIETGNTEHQDKSVIMTENKEIKDFLKTDTDIKKVEKLSKKDYENYDVVIVLGKDYDLAGE
ncbi:LCP family protein [Clostridium gasigenes]|uniref:LCP family protein n=1 Tax=Clostridium gasigenes TaxID=94869 RepID=UPI001C0E1D86|nr:LCP family protein [Clostridium gasigenes]MBU3103781.1 LCP family protein [Clostridium gasigenes]